jgi:hypothetical protein
MEFSGLSEKQKQLQLRVSAKEIKTLKSKNVVFIGRFKLFEDFRSS